MPTELATDVAAEAGRDAWLASLSEPAPECRRCRDPLLLVDLKVRLLAGTSGEVSRSVRCPC